MSKYNEIEIQTAENLLKNGYNWIARERSGKIVAYKNKPHRVNNDPYCAWDDDFQHWIGVEGVQKYYFGDEIGVEQDAQRMERRLVLR